MERDFYKGRMTDKHGIDVITPNADERKIVHDVIYQELCLGQVKEPSKAEYLKIIDSLAKNGAEAVILGCTEIGMLVKQEDTKVPLLDTTEIHAEKAVQLAVKD
jgi:aspartate racemase